MNLLIAVLFLVAAAALAALGLGILHVLLSYGSRFWGSLCVASAVGLVTGGLSAGD